MAADSVVYVDSDSEAKALRAKVSKERAKVAQRSAIGFILILASIVWTFLPLMADVPAGSPVIRSLMMYIGAAWVAYCKGANVLWFLVGPFVVLLPTIPKMPDIKVGPKPSLADYGREPASN